MDSVPNDEERPARRICAHPSSDHVHATAATSVPSFDELTFVDCDGRPVSVDPDTLRTMWDDYERRRRLALQKVYADFAARGAEVQAERARAAAERADDAGATPPTTRTPPSKRRASLSRIAQWEAYRSAEAES